MNIRQKVAQRLKGWEQLAWIAVSMILSYAAGKLLAKKRKSPIDDNKPTTLTHRGAFTPWICGVRRIGPVFAHAGGRNTKKEKAEGGKGGGAPDMDVYYEWGWHLLGPGPGDQLHQIIQQGTIIFQGPISRVSHPSGSTVDLGKEGSFQIYWGEESQPINTLLGDANKIGITSSWPGMCYVHWIEKRLGSSPQWQVLDYVLECRPTQNVLTQTAAYMVATETLNGVTKTVLAVVANANPDIGYLEVRGAVVQAFPPGEGAFTTGVGTIPDGRKVVRRVTTVYVVIGTYPITGLPRYELRSHIFFESGTLGATVTGTVQAYSRLLDVGINPAHIIAEALFAEWPRGLGLSTALNAEEPWDIPSLEAAGLLWEQEDIRGNMVMVDGGTVQGLLGSIMQDMGCLLTLDSLNDGMLTFVNVREPVGTLPHISTNIQAQKLPEVTDFKDDLPVDKMVFAFDNRDRRFVTDTIAIDEDGQATFAEYQSADEVDINVTTVFRSAAVIVERRSQELLAGGSRVPLFVNRGARALLPGQAITATGFEDVLRVLEVKPEPLSSKVELVVTPDTYGAPASSFQNTPGGGAAAGADPEEDLAVGIVEVPEYLNAGSVGLLVPRIRAQSNVVSSSIHFSRDNVTYVLQGTFLATQTGGTLTEALDATDRMGLDVGPAFAALGPDIANVQDLSADEVNWRLGRQVCVIQSSGGTEICFLQKIDPLGGGQYRLRGLLRARFDTVRLSHPIGAEVFIGTMPTSADVLFDILLVPGEDLYVKSQPIATTGQVPLSSVTPESTILEGKGVTPMATDALRCTAPRHMVPAYATGEDVMVEWNYRSALIMGTGAGMQGWGNAHGTSPFDGTFEIEVTNLADSVLQTTAQTAVSFSLSNAEIIALLGSELGFKIKIRSVRGGHRSTQQSLTISKI